MRAHGICSVPAHEDHLSSKGVKPMQASQSNPPSPRTETNPISRPLRRDLARKHPNHPNPTTSTSWACLPWTCRRVEGSIQNPARSG